MWLLGIGGIGAALFLIPGALPAVINALSALLSLIRRNPWQFAVIALCALSLWLWHGKSEALKQIAVIHAAQKQAGQDQAVVNHEPARKSEEIARNSDAEAPALYDAGRRAGMAYAAAHRVPATCSPRPADLSRADHPAAVDDGPGEAADMVAVSRPDFDQCTDNSTRLAKVRADAHALIEAGVAK